MASTIVFVEDDPTLREMLTYRLRGEGYRVVTAADGPAALAVIAAVRPDLILLDLLLPGLDGLEVCKQVRAQAATRAVPIVILSGRSEERDRILGFDLGADDYIFKPFSWPELRARLRAQLRRVQPVLHASAVMPDEEKQGRLTIDDLAIDLDQRKVWRATQEIDLTTRLFDLLTYFARHCGLVLPRSRLLEEVWGYDAVVDTRTVDVHIRWLREKVEVEPALPQRIQTVRGVGYRLACTSSCDGQTFAREN